jgi:hypothetical protein
MLGRMKTMTDSAQDDYQRTVEKSRRIVWWVYLLGAASLLVLWFVAGSTWVSYVFGGWMLIGAVGLWLIEDAVEY